MPLESKPVPGIHQPGLDLPTAAEIAAARAAQEAVEATATVRRTAFPDAEGAEKQMVWHIFGAEEKPALVLLHGGSGSWNHWFNTAPRLAEKFRVYAADLPGMGESDPPDPPHTATKIAAIVKRGIEQLLPRGDRYHLCCFSFGSVIGATLAALDGGRPLSLTFVGAPVLGEDMPRTDVSTVPVSRRLPLEESMRMHRHNLMALMLAHERNMDTQAVYMHATNARRAQVKSRPLSRSPALPQALPNVRAPIAGIWGSLDAPGYRVLDRIEAVLRDAQADSPFEVIPDAGHWVMYEAPDAFLARYDKIVRSLDS